MVAVLMVIVAFQAGINTPGGVWQDTGFHNATKLSSNFPQSSPPKLVRHYAGQSVMSFADRKRCKDFFMFNIITLASSMLVVILLLSKRLINSCSRIFDAFATILTLVSILAMSANYGVSLSFISPENYSGLFPLAKSPFILMVVLYLVVLLFMASAPKAFHVHCFEIIWFRKRLVFGPKSVQSREVGSPWLRQYKF